MKSRKITLLAITALLLIMGVLFAPGSQFLHDGRASRCMRLTVAQADEAQIRRGIEVLGRVVRARLEADPTSRQAASVNV